MAVVWQAKSVPYVDGVLAYHLYEGHADPSQSDYHWWHANGLAGAVLKPSLRVRLGLPRSTSEIPGIVFGPPLSHIADTDCSVTASGDVPPNLEEI